MGPIFYSDLIKVQRSMFWGIVILFPFILLAGVTLLLILNFQNIQQDVYQGKSYSIWGSMWMVTYYSNFVMIHLFVTVLTSFLANVEHQANAFNLIFSMPISRVKFYWVRYFWIISGVILSSLFLMLGFWLIGMMFGGGDSLDWSRLFHFTMFPYLSSFSFISFQLWISMNIKNQSIPVIIGGLGIVAGLFMLPSPGIAKYFPWVIPYQITLSEENIITDFSHIVKPPIFHWEWIGISLIVGFILVSLGALQFARKEMI
ncbi:MULTISPECIES: ABC transporter permease [Bacillaceae]|jgi:lantibiotic transport system permease protein|nr:ABC transporter permease [Virgibacillus sp. YIM 98842]